MHITRENTVLTPELTTPFNRYSLSYSATTPLRCALNYEEGGIEREDEFFLEAGEDRSFSSLICGYLSHKTADRVISLTVRTIAHDGGEFICRALTAEMVPVLAEKTYYFENHRYRVGVELCWGGGLSYIQDKKCPVEGLENLLNHADTGRLVQQSYYGTDQPPYECVLWNGTRWRYNPVQGGDHCNNKSRLIDVQVSEGEVYVKCRPRDWGHNGGTTYAYMENRYRLEEDCLWVDNRFVDFSGWVHNKASQEVPAFYTVSYLNNYYWYDGDQPWTDDELSVKSDLPFWPTDWGYCTFHPKAGNTEVWSAFVDDGGYGLGLFTPNIHKTIAGRHMYDGSKDPAAGSCGYIAPLRDMALRSFVPVCYAYVITAGYLNDIRETFKARRNEEALQNRGFDTCHAPS